MRSGCPPAVRPPEVRAGLLRQLGGGRRRLTWLHLVQQRMHWRPSPYADQRFNICLRLATPTWRRTADPLLTASRPPPNQTRSLIHYGLIAEARYEQGPAVRPALADQGKGQRPVGPVAAETSTQRVPGRSARASPTHGGRDRVLDTCQRCAGARRLDQFVERGTEPTQGGAGQARFVVRGAVGWRRHGERSGAQPRFFVRDSRYAVPIAPSRRPAASASPYGPVTRYMPAPAVGEPPMAVAQTAARSPSRSANAGRRR